MFDHLILSVTVAVFIQNTSTVGTVQSVEKCRDRMRVCANV